ncbi:heme/hemin ABC transporter substrate-binding protein [Pedobacter metabolipauper]|uniref:Iron complex transport system substrate-binding protein n=1 Tax=Pedobacter metabolipauper TaxID=425513 RepID=A0A4R6SVG1_9SPHI|nr:ABC transporter substrate-binding protein [Pedobacter metabolipauper]TDQ08750.1 iron complex transport system substrate-binding protein [Pedobacter metabolipauper]
MKRLIGLCLVLALFSACRNSTEKNAGQQLPDTIKIVSLNGTVSEIVAELGLEKNIVGTDITSNYPESLKKKPKIGHNRKINVEGVLALQPNIVVGIEKEVPPQLAAQFRSAGIKLLLFKQEFSAQGTKDLIRSVGDSLQSPAKADSLIKKFDAEMAVAQKQLANTPKKAKVLFLYARGTGTMMVAGAGTQVQSIIELAGAQNAVVGFNDYKPLTPESLVQANPDVILLFDDGLESLGGVTGLLGIQGVSETNAGKNKSIITMNGELLTGFGMRLGIAIKELSDKINAAVK